MGRFILSLTILFLVLFVIQESHLVEKKDVPDTRLGVSREEYHLNWDNLKEYLQGIPEKVKKLIPKKR